MIKRKTVSIVVALALIALGASLIARRRRAIASLPPPDRAPLPVATAAVRDGAVAGALQTVALIVSDRTSTVAAQVSGSVLEVRHREGDRVERGELLVRIDARVLEDAVESAQARLAAAQEDLAKQEAIFTRDSALFESHDIAPQAFDVSKAQLESSKAAEKVARRALESAHTARSYADVVAPYAGVITARLVEPGDLAAPGKPLFTLQVYGPVRMQSKVSQDLLGRLEPGSGVVFSAGGKSAAASVTRVYPSLDASRLGVIETELPSPPFGLPPGATVTASYSEKAATGFVVPVAALLQGLSETIVVRVRNGMTDAVPVVVSSRSTADASVAGRLAVGDRVIIGLPSELMALTSGVRVSPVEE
jgi:RND family efflux transporter MFP subunit